ERIWYHSKDLAILCTVNMHPQTEILMVSEKMKVKVFNQKMAKPLEPLSQYLGNHKYFRLGDAYQCAQECKISFNWHKFCSKKFMAVFIRQSWHLPLPPKLFEFVQPTLKHFCVVFQLEEFGGGQPPVLSDILE